MHSRASRIVVVLALLICLVCPLLETFDTWDHTVQTGNDTEYALVVLALCVSVGYSFARFILIAGPLGLAAKSVFPSYTQKVFCFPRGFSLLPLDALSPPPVPLRI